MLLHFNYGGKIIMLKIDRVNRILKKYDIELKEGVRTRLEFFSKVDLQKITRIDKTLLDGLSDIHPTIYDVVYEREEIFVDALIIIKGDKIFTSVEGIYFPMDLSPKKFNYSIDYGRYPNFINKVIVKGKDYLYLEWCKF